VKDWKHQNPGSGNSDSETRLRRASRHLKEVLCKGEKIRKMDILMDGGTGRKKRGGHYILSREGTQMQQERNKHALGIAEDDSRGGGGGF